MPSWQVWMRIKVTGTCSKSAGDVHDTSPVELHPVVCYNEPVIYFTNAVAGLVNATKSLAGKR